MKKTLPLIIISVSLTLMCCKEKYPADLYGTYEKIDTTGMSYTELNFYRKNNYSFYSGTCMDRTRDTGEFYLSNNILTCKSFLPVDTSGFQKFDTRLTNVNFNYRPGKIYYLQSSNPSRKSIPGEPDTTATLIKRITEKPTEY